MRALIAFLEDESSAGLVEDYLRQTLSIKTTSYISVINLGEIWYSFAHRRSETFADNIITEIENLPIEVINAYWDLTYRAAGFKASGGPSYADCFATALCDHFNACLITGDPEFQTIADRIAITWV